MSAATLILFLLSSRRDLLLSLLLPVLLYTGCTAQPTTTTLTLGPVLHTNVQRFGINLSGQNYYDSGQILRNLTYRNPGFEGGAWQSILHCKTVTANTCTDENQWTVWPANFLRGARYDILPNGGSGTVTASTAASQPNGVTLTLSGPAPTAGGFLLIDIAKPGDAQAGWWTEPKNGATLSTETKDLSPNTPGKQALRIEAAAPNQSAKISSFFDSYNNRSFLQLHGRYTLTFRAKSLSLLSSRSAAEGSAAGPPQNARVTITRLDTTHGNHTFLSKSIPLTPTWRDYTLDFTADENGSALGPIQLAFDFTQTSALLDDVALTEAAAPNNPTAFRNAVVETLRTLHPGILRYMDAGASFGSSLQNLLAPQFARQRTGASTQQTLQEDIAIGLPDFLTLCQAIGADPWISLPPGLSPDEARSLIAWLNPWTPHFHTIHLELGNEQWNFRSFAGSTINDPKAYAQRAALIFAAARSAPAFKPASYDLVLGSWATVPWYTMTELAAFQGRPDSVAVAPYLFNSLNDTATPEAIFGPMFAQPEQVDSRPNGYMAQQVAEANKSHTKLSVYEVNLSTVSGSATQSDLDRSIPSLAAGLTLADHMLLMLRDLGITNQCLYSLTGYVNGFAATSGKKEDTPLWGSVIDMGGPTNLRRPSFLALELINAAILPTMLTTTITGPQPTWNQPKSPNDDIQLTNAHALQTFAFADGRRRSLILLNLSRTQTIPLQLPAIAGPITESRLTGNLTDSNEIHETLKPTHRTITQSQPYALPPHSLTTLTWTTH